MARRGEAHFAAQPFAGCVGTAHSERDLAANFSAANPHTQASPASNCRSRRYSAGADGCSSHPTDDTHSGAQGVGSNRHTHAAFADRGRSSKRAGYPCAGHSRAASHANALRGVLRAAHA